MIEINLIKLMRIIAIIWGLVCTVYLLLELVAFPKWNEESKKYIKKIPTVKQIVLFLIASICWGYVIVTEGF